MALKRNISEIKMNGGGICMSKDNYKVTGQVGSIARQFEALMTSGVNLRDKEDKMIEKKIRDTYESTGKRRRICRDGQPRLRSTLGRRTRPDKQGVRPVGGSAGGQSQRHQHPPLHAGRGR